MSRKPTKVLHVLVGAWLGSGIGEAVAGLAGAVQCEGFAVSVAMIDGPMADSMLFAERVGVRLHRYSSWPGLPAYFSRAMFLRLGTLIGDADIVHVHGWWTFPVWWASILALRNRKTLIVSPHGSLDAVRLRHSAWKKKLAGMLDHYILGRATVIHATCAGEAESIGKYVGHSRECQVVVIPVGVNVSGFDGGSDPFYWARRLQLSQNQRVVLYLGRLHPLKGLDMLIDAWASISCKSVTCDRQDVVKDTRNNTCSGSTDACNRDSSFTLVIMGPDEKGTQRKLEKQVRRLGLQSSVHFCGVASCNEKKKALRAACLVVLPSRDENFGLVVAESLASGVPVITTKATPWSELGGVSSAPNSGESDRCGWWVDVGAAPLALALREAMGMSDAQRRDMGKRGRKWVECRYDWKLVAAQMAVVYQQSTFRDSSLRGG